MSLIKKYKKHDKKYKTSKFKLDVLNNIIVNFVRRKKLVVYGGMAIDKLIRHKSKGSDSLYGDDVIADWDILADDIEGIANELKDIILTTDQFETIKIVTGMTGLTRKLFIDINRDAAIDITYMNSRYLEKNTLTIDGVIYANPQFLKIHQYQNLCTKLYTDNHRMKKSFKKIMKLEKWFPLINGLDLSHDVVDYGRPINNISTGDTTSIEQLLKDYEIIIGGDFVYHLYYEESEHKEIILYTNDLIRIPLPETGKLRSPKYRVMPMIGSMFYIDKVIYGNINARICHKIMLLYQYYHLRFYDNNLSNDDKIRTLLNDGETFELYVKELDKYPKIYNPTNKPMNRKIKKIGTRYYSS